jgi:ABC-type molybdate transport system substrate-binding protein
MTPNETLSIMNALRASGPDDYVRNTATVEWPNDAAGRPLVIYGEIYRAVVLKSGRDPALAKDFVRFLARPLSRLRAGSLAATDDEAHRQPLLARPE